MQVARKVFITKICVEVWKKIKYFKAIDMVSATNEPAWRNSTVHGLGNQVLALFQSLEGEGKSLSGHRHATLPHTNIVSARWCVQELGTQRGPWQCATILGANNIPVYLCFERKLLGHGALGELSRVPRCHAPMTGVLVVAAPCMGNAWVCSWCLIFFASPDIMIICYNDRIFQFSQYCYKWIALYYIPCHYPTTLDTDCDKGGHKKNM